MQLMCGVNPASLGVRTGPPASGRHTLRAAPCGYPNRLAFMRLIISRLICSIQNPPRDCPARAFSASRPRSCQAIERHVLPQRALVETEPSAIRGDATILARDSRGPSLRRLVSVLWKMGLRAPAWAPRAVATDANGAVGSSAAKTVNEKEAAFTRPTCCRRQPGNRAGKASSQQQLVAFLNTKHLEIEQHDRP
jgi:hypothetical protein